MVVCPHFSQSFITIIFVLDFERTNPAVQNVLFRPWIRNIKYLFAFVDAQIISHLNYRALSVVMMSFWKYHRNYFRPVEEGGDCQIIDNSDKAAVSVSILTTDLMIMLKGGPKTQSKTWQTNLNPSENWPLWLLNEVT